MASNLIEIIIKAINQTDEASKKASDNAKKVGDAAQKANETASKSSDAYNRKLTETTQKLPGLVQKVNEVGSKGASAFKKLSASEQDSIVKFNMLDKETQEMLQNLSRLGDKGRAYFVNMGDGCQEAVNKLNSMDEKVQTLSGRFEYAKTKMELMGGPIEVLKDKIHGLGNDIQTHAANKWDTIKSKVSSVTSYIKSSFSSALSAVGSKIKSIGDAFSGLGGIISSVIGGIGLKELGDMTIGAAITRERIYSLSEALLGAGQSTDQFIALWNKMDDDTNSSLVSLDQLSQSLSVVKQMTGATGDQLYSFEGILLNIGQRAILMGKDGTEAMSLMQAAGKGLNGEFEMLKENFGITRDKLIDAGWTGAAEDIDGYTKALEECLNQSGDVSGMMDTTHGKLTSLKKMWSVAGRSLGEEFKPYLDQALTSILKFIDANNDGKLDAGGKKWLQYAYGAMAVASGFASVAPTIAPALSVLDDMASGASKALKFLGLMEAEEGAVTLATIARTAAEKLSTLGLVEKEVATAALTGEEVALAAAEAGLTAEEIGAAAAHSAGAGAIAAEGAAASASSFSFLALGSAILTAVWPILLLVGLAVAIYEVGKAFGWWEDIPTMLSAVWSGIQRLWNAFINHPDVQAAISAISNALSTLWDYIQQAGHAVLEFFGINANSNWDIVASIIGTVGAAWDGLKGAVMWVVGVFQQIYSAFNTVMNILGPFGGALLMLTGPVGSIVSALRGIVCILLGCSPGIVPALNTVQEVFTSVWDAIAGFIGGIVESIVGAIQPIIDILTSIADFYLQAFMYAWQTMIMVFSIVSVAVNRIINIFSLFLSGQINLQTALSMIWNTLTSMFAAVFNTIISRVTSFASKMVTKALAMGRQFVSNIINNVKQLPGKVYSQLVAVVSKIVSAGQQWVSNAKSKAQSIVSNVYNTLSGLPGKIASALSGVVNAIVKPFQDAYNGVAREVNKIKDKVNEVTGIDLGWGGDELFIAPNSFNSGVDLSQPSTPTTVVNNNMGGELTLIHDFKNLPDGVSADDVAEIVLATANSSEFGKAIATNNGFQSADLKVKNAFIAKNNRARGV